MRRVAIDIGGIAAIPIAIRIVQSSYPDAEKRTEARIDCFSQSGADLQRKACMPPILKAIDIHSKFKDAIDAFLDRSINHSICLLVVGLLCFSSCKTQKHRSRSRVETSTHLMNIDVSKRLKEQVAAWLGVPYKFGGNNKQGIDCSAFVNEIYRSVYKIELPRTVRQQYMQCKKVNKEDLKEGDLVFFKPGSSEVSHVGIYLNKQQFVHASSSKGVVISELLNTYYKKYFVAGGRYW